MGRFRKFGALSWSEKLLLSEAYFMHLTTGLILKAIPFRWIPTLFSSQSSVHSPQSEEIELIRTAVQRAGMVSPWRNRCLVSSLAARCMLRRRKIHSQLSLGVAKDDGGKMIAHAWLMAGEAEIVPKGADFQQLYQF